MSSLTSVRTYSENVPQRSAIMRLLASSIIGSGIVIDVHRTLLLTISALLMVATVPGSVTPCQPHFV